MKKETSLIFPEDNNRIKLEEMYEEGVLRLYVETTTSSGSIGPMSVQDLHIKHLNSFIRYFGRNLESSYCRSMLGILNKELKKRKK